MAKTAVIARRCRIIAMSVADKRVVVRQFTLFCRRIKQGGDLGFGQIAAIASLVPSRTLKAAQTSRG